MLKWYAVDDEYPDEGESANATPDIDVHWEKGVDCYYWRAEIHDSNGDDPHLLLNGVADTAQFAKSCAESRLTAWVGRQAKALGITRIS